MNSVTIYRFLTNTPANLYCSVLRAKGIDAWLDNENLGSTNPFYALAIHGIQLKVPEDQVEAALDMLQHPDFAENDWRDEVIPEYQQADADTAPVVTPEECCPNCGSTRVKKTRFPVLVHALWILICFIFAVLGFIETPGASRHYCRACGWSWDTGSGGLLPGEDDECGDDTGDPAREGQQEYDQD